MNPSNFDMQFSLLLGDPVTEPGQNGAVVSFAARQMATIQAIKEYTRYRPALRKFGTGYTYGNCGPSISAPISSLAGMSFVMIGGGGFVSGSSIVLDPYTAIQETVVISSVIKYNPVAPSPGPTSGANLIQVNLSSSLQYSHSDAAYVTLTTPGLRIVGGQNTYPLPYDWRRVEQSSFDVAVGAKMAYKEGNGYYDASYVYAMEMTGLGMGYSATYGVGSPYGYAIAGDPFNNPNGAPGGSVGPPEEQGFKFYDKTDEPLLYMSPVPATSLVNALVFDYYAQHSTSTIPNKDEDAVLNYALYCAYTSMMSQMAMGSNFDRKIAQVEYMPSRQLSILRQIAMEAKKDFDQKIRWVPHAISG